MPHIVDVQIKNEGYQKGTIHFYLESDGSLDFNNDILFNFNTDWTVPQQKQPDPVFPNVTLPLRCTIEQAWVNSSWFDITLGWGGAPVRNNLVLSRDTENYNDFRPFGGITVPADATDVDGTLRISTKDFQPTGSNGLLVLAIRKN